MDKLSLLSIEYAKELQKELLGYYSKRYLGNERIRETYYKEAIAHERIYEGDYAFDARIIFITQEALDTLLGFDSEDFKLFNPNIISGIGSKNLSMGFGLIHLRNKFNIGVLAIPEETLSTLPSKSSRQILDLFQQRAGEGNHDRFHNKSMATIDKVLVKERYYTIRDQLLTLQERSPLFRRLIFSKPKLYKMWYKMLDGAREMKDFMKNFDDIIAGTKTNNTKQKSKSGDDFYVRIRKFYDNHIRDPKRKKINVPNTIGGGRTKYYDVMMGIPGETHMYEYLSQLVHFRFLDIVYNNHPEIKQKIIKDTEQFLSLIDGSNIEQNYKDGWIAAYLRFTSRVIDLKEINLKNEPSFLPEIFDHQKLDIFAFNEALVTDNIRMDEGLTVT